MIAHLKQDSYGIAQKKVAFQNVMRCKELNRRKRTGQKTSPKNINTENDKPLTIKPAGNDHKQPEDDNIMRV